MKISCPNCPAAYELDDSRIPPAGLSIKCPKCKTPFIVHKPKPGDGTKVVKGAAVPLPGQGGVRPPQPKHAAPAMPAASAPASSASPGAVPLPGIDQPAVRDDPFAQEPSLGFGDGPPLPKPVTRLVRAAADEGAVPLPGLDVEAGTPSDTLTDQAPVAAQPPADGDFPVDDDAVVPKALARPPPPPPRSMPPPSAPPPPPSQQAAMDDIFSVDVPEAPPAPPPPQPRAARPPPAVVDDPGISFDFVEAPPRSLTPAPAPTTDADMLDFVDEGADKPAPAPEAKSDRKQKRAPPPMIARSGPANSEELSIEGDFDEPASKGSRADDAKKAEKERKKAGREERKAKDREERQRRKSTRSDRFGPVLQSVREGLRNPRTAGASVLAIALLVFVVMGIRARRTPAGFFWTNKYVPSKKAATAAESKVIDKGMERMGEGSFAGAREAVGMAAQLAATLPDDEDVKAFYVLATSELKLIYGQVGGDWDQAKTVVEKMKGKLPQHDRARGAFALANGDVPRGRQLLSPLGERPDADLESIYLFAQSLILSNEQGHAAQVLDNALKTRDSTKLLLLRGLVARQKNQLPESAAFFEKALLKSPGNGRSLVELADVKLRQGDLKATADLLDKALQPEVRKSLDATEEARASMLRGKLLSTNHQRKEAEAAYERAVALDPNSSEIHETYGEFRLARRDWEKASKEFDLAIAAGAPTAIAYAGAARAYLGQNRLLEADKRMNDAVRLDGSNPHFMYLQGRVAEAIGKGEEALKDYDRALQKKPDLAEALVAEGTIFLTRGDKEKAREKLEAALKVPDAGRTSIEDEAVGDLALALGEKEKGRAVFALALAKDPEDPLAHSGLGKSLAALGQLPEARVELEKALAEVDTEASLHYEYGSLLRKMGDPAGALTALQKAVKLDSKDSRFRARLGAVLVERSDFEQAEQHLRQAVLMNDRFAEAQFFLARALAGQKKLSEAIDTMKKAVEIEPDSAESLYYLGLIYEQGQQVQDAIESFEKSIDKNPKSADALEHLGQNLTVENRFGDAVVAFKKAADLDPKRARLWAEVADSEQQAGDTDGAIRDFQKALAQDATLTGVWSKLGVAYKDKDCKGCKAKAMDALRHAAQVDPTDAVAHHELGYMYKDDGRRREAIAEFRRYIELRPDAGDLSTVQDDIYYLQEESRRAP